MVQVIYANTHDSDMYYKVGMHIPDPFFYLNIDGEEYVFLDHREFGVFKKYNKNDNMNLVLSNPLIKEANELPMEGGSIQKLVCIIFEKYNLLNRAVEVGDGFPLSMADFLREKGVNVKVKNPLLPEREVKSSEEISAIREAVKSTERAYGIIVDILKNSSVEGEQLFYKGSVLTSEFLKKEVEKILIEDEMVFPEGMIISSGEQTVVPHNTGSGEIRPNSPIICDIFPRSRRTGYYADMTRTFIKGEPASKFVEMYKAVQKVQEGAVRSVAPGKSPKEIHGLAVRSFEDMGYDVGDKGFVHGVGHSFGLDIHEAPYINSYYEGELRPGNIVTIEPGLYYSGKGGVRIEDDILVTENGYENLCSYPKDLQIL